MAQSWYVSRAGQRGTKRFEKVLASVTDTGPGTALVQAAVRQQRPG